MQISLLDELKDTNQDFEWYPTTNEIISKIAEHLADSPSKTRFSVLDVGAGDGKLLKALKEADIAYNIFAIEKSQPLLDSLDLNISIVGTDFWEQTLVDKKVDVVFSNPPYSEFAQWSEKVIKEANSTRIYLVLPQRWSENKLISEAIKLRKAEVNVIGSFDFLNSEDRKARAKVDLVFIDLRSKERNNYYSREEDSETDPFDLWASNYFGLNNSDIDSEKMTDYQKREKEKESLSSNLNQQLVIGKNMIEALSELYLADMQKLIKNYKTVSEMDSDLMKELDVSVKSILSSLKLKIKGLKDLYWNQLFDRYEPITSRLTYQSRDSLLSTLRERTNIDFTASNAYAITIWAIKNANKYFDSQLINVFEEMCEKANVVSYKSNQRVFGQGDYRYRKVKADKVKLEYRIVCEYIGGIDNDYWSRDRFSGLHSSAYNFLNNILIVANNLGFLRNDSVDRHTFLSGKKEEFTYHIPGEIRQVLMEVKAFKNGNLHIKFSQDFMLALNVEMGRLKGWIHTPEEAAEELGEDLEKVSKVFKTQYTMIGSQVSDALLLGKF